MRNSKTTMAWKLLAWIGTQSPLGVTLTEIQFYIWTVLEGKSASEFYEPGYSYDGNNLRKTRGHWCTALYGGFYYHGGLLHLYCDKVNGRWVLTHMPKENEIIYKKISSFHKPY